MPATPNVTPPKADHDVDDVYPVDTASPPRYAPPHWVQPVEQAQLHCPQLNRSCLVHGCAALRTGMFVGRKAGERADTPALLPLVYCGLAHPNDPVASGEYDHGLTIGTLGFGADC